MKKIFSITLIFAIFISSFAYAKKDTNSKRGTEKVGINIGLLESYSPFTWKSGWNKTDSLIHDEVDKALLKNGYQSEYLSSNNIEDLLIMLESGDLDILLVNYFEEDLEKRFDYIYPAYIKNPLVLVTLPNSVKNVKSLDDLKKYKGVVRKDEAFTTYVNGKIKAYNIKKAENSYKSFDMLFSGEADFILTSKYAAMVEIMKYGLKNRVAVSKQSLYQMPMFITVSKVSPFRKKLRGILSKMLSEKSNYNNDLVEKVRFFQKKYKGAVPPNFTDPEDKVSDELTPEELAEIEKKKKEEEEKRRKEELIKKNELDKATKEMDEFFK